MKRIEAFAEEAAALLLTAYLFIMFCMFPFYMRSGYMEIGKDKYDFFKAITAGGFCLIVPLVLLCICAHAVNRRRDSRERKSGISGEDNGIKGRTDSAAEGGRNGESEGERKSEAESERNGESERGIESESERGIESEIERGIESGRKSGIEDERKSGRADSTEDEEEWEETQDPRAVWCRRMSGTDWAVFAYGVSVILSYIGSEYKEMALYGEPGWYMGTVMQLVFVLSYFLVSRFWEYEQKLLFAFMAASGVVFALGVLNRFSIFPFPVQGANSSYISTLGNINWYCGYWAVLFPIGLLLYWRAEELWFRIPALLFLIVGIATGVSQGSSSAFIVFTGLYVFLFCLSFKSTEAMKRFFLLAFLFCAVCQGLRLWRLWKPEAFDYYEGTLSDWITLSRVTLAGLIAAAVFYFVLWLTEKKKDLDVGRFKVFRQILVLFVVIAIGVYFMLLILNSRVKGGIRFLGGFSALTFNRQWGSARGATWSAGIRVYRSMPLFKKLIGVGPDCFASFLYTISDLVKILDKQFSGARLTNAHNEWLNVLVNTGIFGLISYGSIFISGIVRFVYYGEKVCRGKGKYLCIFGFSAFAYMIHNVVSFQQILSTPFVFLMLGMGECLLQTEIRS